uniref:Uncharacterized protein n=1 Tax=Setaria italica TaxID=4555 RepID=K3Z1A9_SETIT
MQSGVASIFISPSNTLATVDIKGLLLLSTCKHHMASFIVSITSSTWNFMSLLLLSTKSDS